VTGESGNSREQSEETRSFKVLTPGTVISHYKIIEKLGEGGMGVVYKAEDAKLKRHVALKFLPPHLTRDAEARERFLLEAQAASALDHPNICNIHEIDETVEGETFISMACYEGETLRGRISRGPMISDKVIDISIQVASGLAKAHAKGIVHRDIKPANMMITPEGTVKIMDFGLAKLAGQVGVTRTGTIMGTIAYMSPEQIRGEEVDHRSDIWSLGVVMYEMLAGDHPFKGAHEHAVTYSILNEDPEPLTLVAASIPGPLAAVVEKALNKDRDRRYQDSATLKCALEACREPGTAEVDDEKSIVVLPFDDMSPGKDNEHFSDGLTEEIITDLSQVHELRVISRTSAMQLKGTSKGMKAIGRDLDVRYALEGSVRKAGESLRITAQLIDTTDDRHVWAEKYSGTLEDVFDIQERVSRAIVDAIRVKLTPEESEKFAKHPIPNVQAYECYLKARQEVLRFAKEGLDRALRYLQNALDIVGENALIYAGMGYVYWQYVNAGFRQEDFIDKALECADKVFELDPESLHAHLLLGMIRGAFQGDQQGAADHLTKVLATDPNNPDAMLWLANTYGVTGQLDAARSLCDRLLRVDPLTPINHHLPGILDLMDGRFEMAVDPLREGYRVDPDNPGHRWIYAWGLVYAGKAEEAMDLREAALKSSPKTFWDRMTLFALYGVEGRRAEALEYFDEEAQSTARRDPQYSWKVATCYAILGDKEKAIEWLTNAVDRGFVNYPFLNEYDPFWADIRGDERFKSLMKRAKAEWESFRV
jgi:non-specific serine/threonine protein kinase